MTEERVAFELHRQVAKAAHGQDHHHVTTVLTRAMWQVFLRGIGLPDHEEPNAETLFSKARRVAGSHTVVLDVPGMWAVSCLTQKP
jgi:hypothetical protein